MRETVYSMRAFERRLIDIMQSWEEELQAFRRRTKKSAQAWETAKKRIPFGVNSNYRLVDPYPLYVRKAKGSRIWDADGTEYIDFCMAFGALVAGHSHPVLAKAMRDRVANGTIFGFESVDAGPLADHLCRRFQLDRLKFSMTGLDTTLFAVRLARAVTGRRRILKFEGCYHGSHDALMVSIKPKKEVSGDRRRPTPVPSSKGLLPELLQTAVVAPFNDLAATEALAREHADDIAGIILEPVPMNMGYVHPRPGFLDGLRKVATEIGALLIFDEVITGFRVAYGGAQALYGVRPDLTCLGKIIGGGLPVGAYGGRRDLMSRIAPLGPVYQAGTLSGNPLAVAAGLATLRALREGEVYRRLDTLGAELERGLLAAAGKAGVPLTVNRVGSMLTGFFTNGPVTDYATAKRSDTARYGRFFHEMLARGVFLAPSQFEAAFVSLAHREADIAAAAEAAAQSMATAH